MKRLTQIFQALLGVAALMLTTLIAVGRLAWRTICYWWRDRSGWLRRSIVITFALISICFVARVAYIIYDDAYGRDYYWDKDLSRHITLRSFSDNKWRVYNKLTQEYTTKRINWVSDVVENDSLAVYALPNKRGYINVYTGDIVIDAEANAYRKAWVFSDGLAAVMKEGKIGFVNTSNEVVIPFQFDYTDRCRMYDFGYVFHNGYCAMTSADGALGLIDKSGNWVVEPIYDEIWAPCNEYRVVVKDGMYGILDAKCDVVYPTEYDRVDIQSVGFVLNKEGRKWSVDFEGNIVQSFMFDGTYYLNYPIGYDECDDVEYAFADYLKYEVLNNYGIMNRITGEPITPAIYSDINMLSKDLFEVRERDSYDWYLLDSRGQVVSKK